MFIHFRRFIPCSQMKLERGSSASCYVETARLEGFGGEKWRPKFPWEFICQRCNIKIIPQICFPIDWVVISSPRFCRADLGWIFYFGLANFWKIAREFLSEFWWQFYVANFSALFFLPGFETSPKIHAQNRQRFSPISLSRTQKCFHADFLLTWETK